MKLILICGAPASGKTQIGTLLTRACGYDFCSKDAIKEQLFDESHKRQSWRAYENQAQNLFFQAIADHVRQDRSLIAENNFMAGDKERLQSCIRSNVQVAVIYCYSRKFTGFGRFMRRYRHGERHADHRDYIWFLPMFLLGLGNSLGITWPIEPLRSFDKRLELDTTTFDDGNSERALNFVRTP